MYKVLFIVHTMQGHFIFDKDKALMSERPC